MKKAGMLTISVILFALGSVLMGCEGGCVNPLNPPTSTFPKTHWQSPNGMDSSMGYFYMDILVGSNGKFTGDMGTYVVAGYWGGYPYYGLAGTLYPVTGSFNFASGTGEISSESDGDATFTFTVSKNTRLNEPKTIGEGEGEGEIGGEGEGEGESDKTMMLIFNDWGPMEKCKLYEKETIQSKLFADWLSDILPSASRCYGWLLGSK